MPTIIEDQNHRSAAGADYQTGLAQLRLNQEDLEVLARQGFISCERPGNGRPPRYKLRFRREGKQVVRYISSDTGQVERIRGELATLQRPHQVEQRLSVLTRQARRVLRQAKRQIEPALNEYGFGFHGLAVRRRRPTDDADGRQ
jgi:hypothetical protein